MPTIEPGKRMNFDEVELGYENAAVAHEETGRCMECGCVRYFDCDLKKIATDYNAEQGKYPGEFKQYKVKFDHPFIEIDNNKCVLCARCVRICSEVVGANALGLVNRGYETYVAPALGNKLQDTTCESCGMCISACPTAAMSENFKFKPGPVKLDVVESVCHYCSVGCKIQYHVKGGFVWQVTGAEGQVNADGNLCRFPKFGYVMMNDKDRITKPMKKVNGKFTEITFEEAYKLMAEKMKEGKSAFFAGARLTNEEMYLIGQIAGKTKDAVTGSFHYLGRHKGYSKNIRYNVPFSQLGQASHIWLLASEINQENAVAGFMIHNQKFLRNIPVTLITRLDKSSMEKKCDEVIRIKSNYYFIKAANHYILSNNLQNEMFLKNVKGYSEYKKALLSEDFASMCESAGCSAEVVKHFAETYNNAMNGVLLAAEKNHCAFCATEIRNLAMITGKLGKTASGILALKEKNNSEGLINSGLICHVKENSPEEWSGILGSAANLFIFGEDPIGCAIEKEPVEAWLSKKSFIAVQDYFMTETAKKADLILPASYAPETGGSYTNTQRVIQLFDKVMEGPVKQNSITQLLTMAKTAGINGMKDCSDVHAQMLKAIAANAHPDEMELTFTAHNKSQKYFAYGCDAEMMRTSLYFDNALKS